MNTNTIYEFPLNERIRVFIRLEQLFKQFSHFSAGTSVYDKRAAIAVLMDIMMIFRRNDLKSEILKELDRHAKLLNKIANSQSVNTEKLQQLLATVTETSQRLYASSGKIGIQVMESDLFQSISQRCAIPGGSCSFDLPEYHYWLEKHEEERLNDLARWFRPFNDARTAIDLILDFIRGSNSPSHEVAEAGFFQFTLDSNQPYQLVIVELDKSLPYFAEISGGKHRCSISFLESSPDDNRPTQSADSIPFTLTCCLF